MEERYVKTSCRSVNHIRPILRKEPDVFVMHIGTNDITNDDWSSLHINPN